MKEETRKSINRLWALLPILLILSILFVFNFGYDFVLKKHGKCAKAILTNNIIHSRSSKQLTYEFHFKGKVSKGNSQEENLNKIGDSICLVYLELFPYINRALKYFDENEIKCDCNK